MVEYSKSTKPRYSTTRVTVYNLCGRFVNQTKLRVIDSCIPPALTVILYAHRTGQTHYLLLLLDHRGLLGDVEPVEELPDVLVLDGRALLDEGSGLRHALDAVAGQDQLVLKEKYVVDLKCWNISS